MDREVIVGIKIFDEYLEFPFPVNSEWDEDEVYSVVVDSILSNIQIEVVD